VPEPLSEIAAARLLLEAARYLGETLEPERVYVRFREIAAEAIPHDGVIVSSFDAESQLITCDYAWADGRTLDIAAFPPLRLREGIGMQSEAIRTGEPLLVEDVAARVRDSGTYYDVDSEGRMRKVPDEGAPLAQSALMVPVKHERTVVGVVQLWSDDIVYDPSHLELAEGIVAQLGAAIRNARLHEERLRLEAAAAAARAAAFERERAAQILDTVGDGIFSVDDRGVVTFWNRAAERITALPAAAVRGRELAALGAGWQALVEAVPVADVAEAARPVAFPVEAAGAPELWLSFVAVRREAEVVYAFQDVTRVRALDQAKDDLIATVSHELRTPMTAVVGAAHTLLHRDLDESPERRRELLEMIVSQAERLARVADAVLLAGRIDRDAVTAEREPVDVEAVAAATIDALRPSLRGTVTLEARFGGVGEALADRDLLQQVLMNLVDNAVKHVADGGSVVVGTRRDGGRIRIDVSDDGVGIPPDEVPHLFEKFFRSSWSQARVLGGTGLGLYICRELTERMGGAVAVDSAPGRGSTFSVTLPAAS